MRSLTLRSLLLVAVAAPVLPAQGLVGGRLIETRSSRPLGCWEVSLRPSGGAQVARTFTRPDGTFEFVAPAAGAYEYRFRAFGLRTTAATFTSTGPQMDLEATYTADLLLMDSTGATPATAETGAPQAVRGRGAPRYPAALRSDGVEGGVYGALLLDAGGRVDSANSFVWDATRPEFEAAVRRAFSDMRFTLATDAERPSCAFIATPFLFRLEPPSAPGRGACPAVPIDSSGTSSPIYQACQVDRVAREKQPYPQLQWTPGAGESRSGACFSAEFRFVVDTLGVPEPATITRVSSTNASFADAVRAILPDVRYVPARIGSRPVRQVVTYKEAVSMQTVASGQTGGASFPGRFARC